MTIHHTDGSVTEVSLFVAVMGFSNKTYVEAFENEQLEHWLGLFFPPRKTGHI